MKKLVALIVILTCVIFADANSGDTKELPKLYWAGYWEIGNIEVEQWADENGNIVLFEAVGGRKGYRQNNQKAKNDASNSNYDYRYHSFSSSDNEEEETTTLLEDLAEKARKTKTLEDVVAVLEEAKKPEYWTASNGSTEDGESEGQVVLIYAENIPNSFDVFVDWIDFVITQDNLASLSMEITSFSSYIKNEPDRGKEFLLYIKDLFENKIWASEKAKKQTKGSLPSDLLVAIKHTQR